MCHGRTLDNKINKLHEGALRLVYVDRKSTFEGLFNNDKSVTIYQKNLLALAIELYKVHRKLSPDIMNDRKNVKYNFTNDFHLQQEMLNLFIIA